MLKEKTRPCDNVHYTIIRIYTRILHVQRYNIYIYDNKVVLRSRLIDGDAAEGFARDRIRGTGVASAGAWMGNNETEISMSKTDLHVADKD